MKWQSSLSNRAAHVGASGEAMVTAFVIGIEAAARLGMVAQGGFHQVGFHPTGMIGVFGCALAAGRLMGLNEEQLAMAQGIALSLASGSLEFVEDGAWNKRLHPGWAAQAGMTAAALAREGFVGATRPYGAGFRWLWVPWTEGVAGRRLWSKEGRSSRSAGLSWLPGQDFAGPTSYSLVLGGSRAYGASGSQVDDP